MVRVSKQLYHAFRVAVALVHVARDAAQVIDAFGQRNGALESRGLVGAVAIEMREDVELKLSDSLTHKRYEKDVSSYIRRSNPPRVSLLEIRKLCVFEIGQIGRYARPRLPHVVPRLHHSPTRRSPDPTGPPVAGI